jgi:L,D-peptidoglycan transpeptidase YkuD (ErfK/YbiS/YcfS/YnhG family)
MAVARILTSIVATATVAACAWLVVGMSRAGADNAGATTSAQHRQLASAQVPDGPARSVRQAAAAHRSGHRLPLHFATHHARRVITVVARSHSSTTARLQAWHKVAPHRWRKTGHAVTAHVGSQGLTSSPSESKSATPIGSFALRRAFGRLHNPGTKLHYFQTTPSDWWISQAGPLYNTHQRCSSGCSFNQGNPNEHLYYETPYYNYAVVIEYNTHHVRQGAGSAFFLHVSVGAPTAGCVSIKQSKLTALMRWLKPHAHPRILIGVG